MNIRCSIELVAQSLLLFSVFRSRNRKHRRRTHPLGHVADAHRFPAPWIGDDHMPAPLVPGITEHRLKPFRKRGFDKKFLSEKWMRHRAVPLLTCERVTHVIFDPSRHQGPPSAILVSQCSSTRYLLIVQPPRWDEYPGAGDPIDGPVHLHESRYFDDGVRL